MQMFPVALLFVQSQLLEVESWLLQSFHEKLRPAETLVLQLLVAVPVQELDPRLDLQVSAVASAPTVVWCLLALLLFLLVKSEKKRTFAPASRLTHAAPLSLLGLTVSGLNPDG